MDLMIRQAKLKDGRKVDIGILNGRITAMENHIEAQAKEEIDAKGNVVIPGLVEGHIHLDKALIAKRMPNKSGTLAEAIEITAKLKPTFTEEDIRKRAVRVLNTLVSRGVTALRAHAEFDPAQGFTGFQVISDLKKEYADLMDIQVVAFPQEGIHKMPGTEGMMRRAMAMGADVVGGIPYNDTSPEAHIDFVFDLAKEFDKPIDFHQDFSDDAANISIEYVCKKTIQEGWQGKVCVGHLTALGALDDKALLPLMSLMKQADIHVMALPATDLHLGGRTDIYNIRRALTPIKKLMDYGINVCLATNNIQNAFTPYGNGDLFQIAYLAIPTAHLGGAEDMAKVLSMITEYPAKAIGLKDYGIYKGAKADLAVLDCKDYNQCVIEIPERLFVVKNGKIVCKTQRTVTLYPEA